MCFIDCRAYGKQAETIAQYMTKGKPILIEGRLQFDTWEGKDGVKRSKHRISIERFQFVGSATGTGGPAVRPAPARPAGQQSPQAPAADGSSEVAPPPPYEEEPTGGEEIPF